MIKIVKSILLIAIAIMLPFMAIAENKTISISTGEWPPFISKNLKHYGVVAHIITESFTSQNIDVEYGWFPWKRTYSNVINRSWDASAVWAITQERSKELLFSDPVVNSKNVMFFNKQSYKDWNSLDDLSGLVIGATNGYFNGHEFEEAEKSGIITVERTSIESNNFKKLAAQHIDAVIAEINTGYDIMHQVLNSEQIESIIVNPKQVSSFNNHLVISKKLDHAEQLILIFNKGLKELTESGKVEQYFMDSRNKLYHKNETAP